MTNCMEHVLSDWKGETLVIHHDSETSAWILIAIHSTSLGPAAGGVRMMTYTSLDEARADVLRLSKAMTYKFAIADMPWGGGKSVIHVPVHIKAAQRESLLMRFGELLAGLNGKYFAGPDIGTSSEDMNVVYRTGAPHVFSRTKGAGGAGSSALPTARGVFAGIEITCLELFGSTDLKDKSILIQGLGSVGRRLAGMLSDAGAKIFFTDTKEEVITEGHQLGYKFLSPDDIYDTPCDVFAPCAQGGIINKETIPRLRCKSIVGAANNQLGESIDAKRLQQSGILYAPDFVVNMGGAMGITAIETTGLTLDQSLIEVERKIGCTLNKVYSKSFSDGITTLEAANQIALQRIESAQGKESVSNNEYK